MEASRRKRIHLIVNDAGGGHRSAGDSFKEAIARRGLPWEVSVLHLYADLGFKSSMALLLERMYVTLLARDWLALIPSFYALTSLCIALVGRIFVARVRRFFVRGQPDLVLSLIPWTNHLLARSLRGTGIPFGIVLTDVEALHRPPWFSREACESARIIAVPSAQAAQAASAAGAASESIVPAGLVIHPKHFEPGVRSGSAAQARAALGLHPQRFTVMLVMGACGSGALAALVRDCESRLAGSVQIIACCGRNERVKSQLAAMPRTAHTRLVVGFTQELHLYMRAADVVVSKPGGCTTWEALTMGTPLVLDATSVMPQEEPNVRFVESQGLGRVGRSRSAIVQEIAALSRDPAALIRLRQDIAARSFRDAMEPIVAATQRLLTERPAGGSRPAASGLAPRATRPAPGPADPAGAAAARRTARR